jgi:hypothetical protein
MAYKLKVGPAQGLKLKGQAGFALPLLGGAGIVASKAGGLWSIDLDYSEFGTGSTVNDATAYVLTWDSASGAFTRLNVTDLKVEFQGTFDGYYQPLDATLTALAALDSTAGMLAQTGADTFARRTLTGTANEVTVTNGDGVSGNPTVSLPAALTFTGKTVTGGTYSGAISFNKVAITSPATGATLTIADGKTLTASDNATVSGTNTGDQTITLTGDVTGSGTGSFATTIGATKVTSAMLNADVFSTAHTWTGQQTFDATTGGIQISGSPAISQSFVGQNNLFGNYESLTAASPTRPEVAAHLGITSGTGASNVVTITIASPAVVTLSNHNLPTNLPIVFSTTGALPTGITAGTDYYVVNATTNNFQVSTTQGGAAVNTSGTQSGVHSIDTTTIAYKAALATRTSASSGSGSAWGLNPTIDIGAGGSKRGGVGIEIDLDNNWGDYTGTPSNPYACGLLITGTNTGGYSSAAIAIEFAGHATDPMWNYGLHFGPTGVTHFNTATIQDDSNSATSLRINGTHNTAVIDISGASTTGYLFKAIGFSVVSTGETIIGGAGVSTGALDLAGVTSGTVKIQPQDVAGTYNFNLPATAGTAGQPLLSGGGGTSPMTFGTLGVAGGGTGLAALTANTIYKGNGTGSLVASSATDDGTTFSIGGTNFQVTEANGNLTITGVLTNALNVSTYELRSAGDLGGDPAFVSYTGISDLTANSTGVGTIKFKGATSRDSSGFLRVRIGTTAYYVPVFSAITG